MKTEAEQFTTPEQDAERQRAYDDVLIDRFRRGLPLSRSDKADARRLIRERAAKSA